MDNTSATEPTTVQAQYNAAVVYQSRPLVAYPDFSVMYLGQEDQTPAGSSATRWVNRFNVIPRRGASQIVEVVSGQLPPAPVEFTVGDQVYTLYTHYLPKHAPKGTTLRAVPGESRFAIFKGKSEE